MQKHMQDTRARLRGLHLLAHRTHESEKQILGAALRRLKSIDVDLAAIKPRTLISSDAAQRYQDLIIERGKLQTVIANARSALGR